MGDVTNIAWCDHTWNAWRGCTHATLPDGSEHPGCLNCYAETMSVRNPKTLGIWGDDGRRVVGADAYWKLPAKWNKQWAGRERRGRVFSLSLGDLFEDRPELVDWREEFFDIVDECQNLDFLCLTKRPQNIRRMMTKRRDNLWLGTSISDQRTAEALVTELLTCRDLSPTLFVSAEPLLDQIDLRFNVVGDVTGAMSALSVGAIECLDWVIVGGESGSHRREMPINAARSLIQQCQQARVAVFVKQDSALMSGTQGRFTDDEFALKEFPCPNK